MIILVRPIRAFRDVDGYTDPDREGSRACHDLIPMTDLPAPAGRTGETGAVRCRVFRVGGGPYVRRPADLTLGWLPCTGDSVDLVRIEQLEFINAADNTIAGIHMVA